MNLTLCLVLTVSLSSCVRTAISPVANQAGVPVVIRVPGTKWGQKATRQQITAIDNKVEQEITKKSKPTKPDARIIGIGALGIYGDMKTKSGEKFIGYQPFLVVRAMYPVETVERAAGVVAAKYYQIAKKHFELIPVNELATQPKKTKP